MSFADMRKNSARSVEQLAKTLSESEKFEGTADTRYWSLKTDATGTGSAVIRFLPASAGEIDKAPYVKVWSHGFKGPTGQWYIERSLTTLGKPDPVSEHNQKLWATETKENRDLASKRKRKLRYISNIYVVKDGANPENEGKVFLYSYGQKIFDKIKGALEPEFEDQEGVNVFDLWTGANFRLRVKKVGDFPNYDASEFAKSAPLLDEDEQLEVVWNTQYKLQDEIAPSTFKAYDELKTRFYSVICEDSDDVPVGTGRAPQKRNEVVDDAKDDQVAAPKSTANFAKAAASAAVADDEDDDMAWFKNLEEDIETK